MSVDKTSFRKRLSNGEQLLGTLLTLPSPEVAELMAMSGFDWLFLDTEHGAYGVLECQRMIQAVGNRCACVVRVPENGEAPIKKALDIGADGIIIPKVNTAEEAQLAVKYAKYSPQGERGVGYSRAHGYGLDFKKYVARANEDIAVIIQIEHVLGVQNIAGIVEVEGIDAVFIGPFDLSASMGKMGEVNAPEVLMAIEEIEEVANNAGLSLGYFGLTPEAVLPAKRKGYGLVVCGTDTSYLSSGAKDVLTALKD